MKFGSNGLAENLDGQPKAKPNRQPIDSVL